MGLSQSCTKKLSVDGNLTTSKKNYEFHSFSKLSDDLVIEILSYITIGPFEREKEVRASLTHDLPLVSSHFRDLSILDVFWLPSLQRLIYLDPMVFKEMLKIMLNAGLKRPPWSVFHQHDVDKDDFMLAAKVQDMDKMKKEEVFELAAKVYNSVRKDSSNFNQITSDEERVYEDFTDDGPISEGEQHSIESSTMNNENTSFLSNRNIDSARSMYFLLVKVYAYPILPVFHMRSHTVRIGISENILLFEPRYRMLIREVMAGRKSSEYRGSPIDTPRPQFIFAHGQNLRTGESAFLVEVYRCRILDGLAHILINPVEKVKLISVTERENLNNGLHDARILRSRH